MSDNRRYWLFKSEPDVFSFGDLQAAPAQTTGWEGVRNYQVRNYLRDQCKLGDQVLFYHSRIEPIGVVGIAEVVEEATPDPSQFDATSEYFDPKARVEAPPWLQVRIRAVRALARVVTLAELKATPGLEKMGVVQRGSRLSITPVTPEEWSIVLSLSERPA
ncbi:MAG: EVE domain-containing protein [Myxococcota bacterium]